MSITDINDQASLNIDPKALAAERKNPRRPVVSRRTVLRGTAALIGLPALESLLTPKEAKAQAAAHPIRFMTWMLPCGIWGPSWFPTDTGAAYTITPTLSPLTPIRNKVLVFAGIQNSPAVNPTGSHGCGPAGMGTCVQGQKPQIQVGISVDQVYAQSLGKMVTHVPSLQISGTDGTYADVDYPAVYNGTTSWAGAAQPLVPLSNPGTIFDQLFAGVTATSTSDPAVTTALAKRKALRKSVLDEVMTEQASLLARLGATDRRKLDEYLTSVRAAETAVQQTTTPANTSAACTPAPSARPTLTAGPSTNGNGKKIVDPVMFSATVIDLMVLAFQCDATRVIAYQQMNGGRSSYSSFPWLGISRDHHGMSHHGGDAAVGALLAQVEKWEIGLFATFLQKLDAIKEGDGTVLDNSLIFLSNELSDGNMHNQGASRYSGFSGTTGKPILLAGTAGGKIKSGRHITYASAPQANLFIALLNTLGVPVTTFGLAGTTPLTGLT